jgi:putative transcriptional regulator
LRIEEFLEMPIILPIDPLSSRTPLEMPTSSWVRSFEGFDRLEKEVFIHLDGLGYRIMATRKSPFDALTKDKKTLIITSFEHHDGTLIKRAKVVTNLSKVIEKHSVIFVEKSKKRNLEGTPLIDKEELKSIDDSEGILELILERKSK